MTKFITFRSSTNNETSSKTEFTYMLDTEAGSMKFAVLGPSGWDNVMWLGNDGYHDIFKTWDNDDPNGVFRIYMGIKGDEFD